MTSKSSQKKPRATSQVPPLPARPADGHKGTFGTVIVVGGSATMIGAPALCAGAALRGGAGLVKIATDAHVLPFALTIEPSATGIALDFEDPRTCLELLDRADPDCHAVLAVGPGWGQSEGTGKLLDLLLTGKRPVVLDADGLNLLAQRKSARPTHKTPLILTPHPGEFTRLAARWGIKSSPTDAQSRPRAALELSQATGAVVVLKGQRTIVAQAMEPSELYINTSGNPALATAGSGDVLTGLTAALLAQKMLPFDAAVLATYLHGLAGDLWAKRFGPSGLSARDLANLIPEASNQLRPRA